MTAKWNYYGVFPNGAEESAPFWGVHGIISTSGSFSPSGVLTADTTTPTTPDTVTIVCSAIFTKLYEWQRKVNGTWTPLLGQTRKQIDLDYALGDGGVYEYRCKLTGWAGEAFTAPVTITVSEPKPLITISTTSRILNIGQTATLTASVMPRPEFAKSIEWQQSTDGTTWTMCGTGREYIFAPTSAGQIHFRAIAIGYAEFTTSNVITITTRNPPTVSIVASATEITTEESSIITSSAEHYNSIKWQIRRGELWETIAGEVGTVYTFTSETAGAFDIRAKVTGDGGEAVSETVTITATEPEPEEEPEL